MLSPWFGYFATFSYDNDHGISVHNFALVVLVTWVLPKSLYPKRSYKFTQKVGVGLGVVNSKSLLATSACPEERAGQRKSELWQGVSIIGTGNV